MTRSVIGDALGRMTAFTACKGYEELACLLSSFPVKIPSSPGPFHSADIKSA